MKKVAVIIYGRFNPPTRGHELLINDAKKLAINLDGDSFIIVSHTQDKDKNPLDWLTKVSFLKHLIPDVNIVDDHSVRSAWHAIDYLKNLGYDDCHLVTGSDRVAEYQKRWLLYADKVFQTAKIHSVGDRNGSDIYGMSASKARLSCNNLEQFKKAVGWTDNVVVNEMMKKVHNGLRGE